MKLSRLGGLAQAKLANTWDLNLSTDDNTEGGARPRQEEAGA